MSTQLPAFLVIVHPPAAAAVIKGPFKTMQGVRAAIVEDEHFSSEVLAVHAQNCERFNASDAIAAPAAGGCAGAHALGEMRLTKQQRIERDMAGQAAADAQLGGVL